MNKALEIADLTYIYRGNWLVGRKKAVQHLNLEVFEGESFGFLGHNGAGKTTTIKCILDLIRAKTGSVKLFGKSSHDISVRAQVGYVPEQPYFYDYLTVAEIMQMYAVLSGIKDSRLRRGAIERALGAVKMSDRADQTMRSLSKGLVQRVALAQAIVANPKLLILDEPFSGMDPIGRKEFRDLFASLKAAGTTIFMCSHILSDVEFLCDRVSIMSQGELKGVFDLKGKAHTDSGWYELLLPWTEEGERKFAAINADKRIVLNAGEKLVLLKLKDRLEADRALELAVSNKIRVVSFNFEHGSLEELFVKLVKGGVH